VTNFCAVSELLSVGRNIDRALCEVLGRTTGEVIGKWRRILNVQITELYCSPNKGVLISPLRTQKGNKLGSMSGTRAISATSRRELSSSFVPLPLQGKATKEIHAIVTETFACFLPGRAKDFSPLMYCAGDQIQKNEMYSVSSTYI